MLHNSHINASANVRTLVASPRNLDLHVSLSMLYEFEDVLGEIEEVDLLCPQSLFDNNLRLYSNLSRVSKKILYYTGIGSTLNPGIKQIRCNKKYQLFFTCLRPSQLLFLNSIKDWRKNCEVAACFVEELWPNQIKSDRYLLKILSSFDHVFLGFHSSTELLSNVIDRPCHYLPVGVDALRFCPYPQDRPRVIDMYSIGRRPERIHKGLLKHVQESNFVYIYDTLRDFYAPDYREHRCFIASLAKRSRYFMVDRPKFDVNSHFEGQKEIGENELGSRFLEGGASGTVMIGAPPTGGAFKQNMDWLDAVISVPLDVGNIVEVIAELDTQPERLAKIRRNNVLHCLMRHDWVYRWEVILEKIGLSPIAQVSLRKKRLKDMADYTLAPSSPLE
jgi:Glycosyl transferases group 1